MSFLVSAGAVHSIHNCRFARLIPDTFLRGAALPSLSTLESKYQRLGLQAD